MTRRALVTGASGAIGRAIAVELATAGFGEILVHYHANRAAAEATADAVRAAGAVATLLALDVCDRAACAAALSADIEANGAYYAVVANAGTHDDVPFPAMSGEVWDTVLSTNLDAFYNVLQPTIMPMIQAHRGGRIIGMASVSGQIGQRGQVHYSAAKAGIIGACRALALELAKRKITVNCVAPGPIESEMTADLAADLRRHIPLGRLGTPAEVAALVAFLCDDRAAFITRQTIGINGGLSV